MKVIKLKNGTEESEALVNLVMKIVRTMFSLDPFLVFHLHRLCVYHNIGEDAYRIEKYNKSYYFIGRFKESGLLDDKENIHPSIANIVLSAVDWDGSRVKSISSPLMHEGVSNG